MKFLYIFCLCCVLVDLLLLLLVAHQPHDHSVNQLLDKLSNAGYVLGKKEGPLQMDKNPSEVVLKTLSCQKTLLMWDVVGIVYLDPFLQPPHDDCLRTVQLIKILLREVFPSEDQVISTSSLKKALPSQYL